MDKLTKEEIKVLFETINNNDDEINNILLQDAEMNNEIQNAIIMATKTFKKKRISMKGFVEKTIPQYSEKKFVKHFRIKRNLYKSLTKRYEKSLDYPNHIAQKLCSAPKSMALFLWFAGHPCSFRSVGRRFDLSISSVSRVIERCMMFLSKLSPKVIKWPDEEQKLQTSEFFKNKAGFLKAIGCIGGRRFTFDPAVSNKKEYIDHNGNPSICVQAVCNEDKKFVDVQIGFPGSSSKSWVFQNSDMAHKLTECGEYYVLGDSAYPCTDNLVTPYRDIGYLTIEQKEFNEKLSSCLTSVVDQSFEMLKQRFPQINYCKLRGIPKICHFIRACCVLHNMTSEDDLNFALEPEEVQTETVELQMGDIAKGNVVRNKICQDMRNQ
ncbi:putative nuclease HARBI1 [Episyrphus balteatus]|uniref:putative nuclease HARBI1 n=1 Tax=Episyrphus balteatus TaxID=286459 RepID=UPI002486C156|nr:putative nuclease HARBI1 [Episyrphus balteatus]